jgi:hypothetical protein
MKKAKYIFIAVLVWLLAISLVGAYIYVKRQERSAQRYHLLCEVLKPGMTKDEVLNALKQAGEFTVIGDEPGSVIALHVVFIDPKGRELYGSFDLGFSDYKYVSAYRLNFESVESICDFH